jgi:CHAT domain-containing protein/tetratricopeptide (TPR) repeat protein
MHRLKYLLAALTALSVYFHCPAQNISNAWILKDLTELDSNRRLGNPEKLRLLYEWKNKSEQLHLSQDSVYARLLHKLAVLEFYVNRNYNTAISLTQNALHINTSGKSGASRFYAISDYYNLGYWYDKMNLFKKALLYYDSAIGALSKTKDTERVIPDSWLNKAFVYFRKGDFEKAVEESDLGIAAALDAKDSLYYLFFLNQRAQALFYQNKTQAALADVHMAIYLGQAYHQPFYLASAWKIDALILARQGKFEQAAMSFRNGINERIKTPEFWQIATDIRFYGKFLSDSLQSYRRADDCFALAIRYARKAGDTTRLTNVIIDQVSSYHQRHDLQKAIQSFQLAMHYLGLSKRGGFLENPTTGDITSAGNTELIQELFSHKTGLLLDLYKKDHDPKWMKACLQISMINDSLIAEIRHEQVGEQSKLYWREATRGFYQDALEACYLANDHNLAFFFMEKSRSVLLQDKLNELGASAFLPPEETSKQEQLQIRIIELQQQLESLPDQSSKYRPMRVRLIQAKENLEQYIKSLEIKYPAYYQYKYADQVRSLSDLQKYLGDRGQQFIEYFIRDSSGFALYVTPIRSQLVKINNNKENIEIRLRDFVNSCSDVNTLNNKFPFFLASSHALYRRIFSPFNLPPGRVIICEDNFLVPFEAFTTDSVKPRFLIRDYSFSYVYSAQYLMNPYEHIDGTGDFLGIAPVNFGTDTGLPELNASDNTLRTCADLFGQSKLLLFQKASRFNFMHQLSRYKTTTIFTHAQANIVDDEPILFMSDSVIHLSELQMLNRPATKLIVLSACQTNAGKNQSGEGVYSLARGFSSAGIPSVAATQWVADNQAIYTISEKFNEFIASGMNKDQALQKAKLFFMDQGNKKNILPFYWADLILIGNSDPIVFSKKIKWKWLEPILIISFIVILLLLYRNWKSLWVQSKKTIKDARRLTL